MIRKVRSRLPADALSVAVLSLLAGVAGVAASYAVAGSSRGYLLVPFADLLVQFTPSVVFRYLRNDLGHTLQLLTAAGMGSVALGVLAAAGIAVARRVELRLAAVPLAAVLAAGVAFLATGTPTSSGAAGVAVGAVVGLGEGIALRSSRPVETAGRRRVLAGLATAGAFGIAGKLVGDWQVRQANKVTLEDEKALGSVDTEKVEALLSEANRKSLDVAGIEPLVSEDFYSVDTSAANPDVDRSEWSLSVTGAVENSQEYQFGDLQEMKTEHRFVTLRCVSDSINGEAMDNALWTGVPVKSILEEANPEGDWVMLHGDDGYVVGFPLEALRGGLLAYGMNGKRLPQAHGYPLRALVPGHWGETNGKWLTEIEVQHKEEKGFWEKRGWKGTGPVHTVAKLHGVNRPQEGIIQVGGHAYGGLQGISAVEVSTDGGETWTEAELSDPLPGNDVWRQWQFEYETPGEAHQVFVRAREADGTLQPKKEQGAHPSGATGWVSTTVEG